MNPKLLTLYGPFELNSFNLLIMLGIGVFIRAVLSHPGRDAYISSDDFIALTLESACAGIVGGRVLHIISEFSQYTLYEALSIWNGGLSILGALLGALCYSTVTLYRKRVSIRAVLDIAALYAPLIHSIARVGCFLTGCCYGAQTGVPWAISYSHPLVAAPLHIPLHPTQLYSSALYILLFILLKAAARHMQPGTGALLALYLMGMSLERFLVDFFRGDRIIGNHSLYSILSFHQWVALGLFIIAFIGYTYISQRQKPSFPLCLK